MLNPFILNMMKKLNLYILLFFSLLIIFSCDKSNATSIDKKTINVKDAIGNEISLSEPAKKIVVLFEPLLDDVYMLGAEDKIIGISAKLYSHRDTYDYLSLIDERIKNKSLATPGDEESINMESIVGLKPDLVIGYQIAENTVKTLKQMGIEVYNGKSETYADTEKELSDLGILLGKKEKSKELIGFASAEFEKIKRQIPNINKKTAYFSWANGRIFTTAGTESMMGQCLDFAGVKNVAESKIDMPNINPETLVSWNPDTIFMWNDSPNLFYNHPQLSGINAVKNKQIYNLMPMFFYNPHNLKALLVSARIQNWAYEIKSEKEMMLQLKHYITSLYGEQRGMILFQALENFNQYP